MDVKTSIEITFLNYFHFIQLVLYCTNGLVQLVQLYSILKTCMNITIVNYKFIILNYKYCSTSY